ncbi:MAG: hypothetical protein A2887_01685 [Alphaproteobacteria bacterium RIFCSPLOWO2_01_FULL_40_26]|nr:MAG: hypothetical protein A3D15_01650 [Alphaproteobacteria bacterium RIFCSPHIGHO2_02_FULL_40_34]OFW94991.1 MAG: hypothetical protein A2887_01685 [Alphaproteobacteria bacterium RIFCSPLOWO2_01_FULL_40_26]OFX10561.1 MAG: hypothetical protein A3H30_02505 [Alphaproteobacteria bacterium RIFCSPLOWO2_02_FULL_40_19]OFX12074.1 MAG: hypothetical protein A3G22_03015 [Alphaproteobacteria bacterium RIFCSPLOWO2_12_FULL_40_11]
MAGRPKTMIAILQTFFNLTYSSIFRFLKLMKIYLLQKKLSHVGKIFVSALLKGLLRLYRLIFTKRTILFVTNEKIRSITLGPIMQACIFLFVAWIANLFMQSLHYDEIVSAKANEINKLKTVNAYFQSQFENANDKLKKVNEYLISITGINHNASSSKENNFKQPESFEEDDLSRRDKQTLNQIKNVEDQFSDIQMIARTRIKKIESAIAITGLNIKKIPSKELWQAEKSVSAKNFSNQGGPENNDDSLETALQAIPLSDKNDYIERHLQTLKFNSEIDYLMVLERLANIMPLSRPMKNYYISSSFGRRADPITRRHALHHGLDFVGVTNEKIVSPSLGKVVLAGKFSNYGNAVVIDHGFGITTRYGHLAMVKVGTGQIVKKGDVIAIQGNTGRSTGPHLHYEVRYKNIPLNPKKFLEAGDALFNNEKTINYANS